MASTAIYVKTELDYTLQKQLRRHQTESKLVDLLCTARDVVLGTSVDAHIRVSPLYLQVATRMVPAKKTGTLTIHNPRANLWK